MPSRENLCVRVIQPLSRGAHVLPVDALGAGGHANDLQVGHVGPAPAHHNSRNHFPPRSHQIPLHQRLELVEDHPANVVGDLLVHAEFGQWNPRPGHHLLCRGVVLSRDRRGEAGPVQLGERGPGAGLLRELLAGTAAFELDVVNCDGGLEALGRRRGPALRALVFQSRAQLVQAHDRVLVLVYGGFRRFLGFGRRKFRFTIGFGLRRFVVAESVDSGLAVRGRILGEINNFGLGRFTHSNLIQNIVNFHFKIVF